MKKTDFSFIAPFYDLISYLVYGNTLRRAQEFYLNKLEENSEILIIGGGTGYILQSLSLQNKKFNITYIEFSEKMLELSKKRKKSSDQKVNYILGSEVNITDQNYDVILAGFFLDVFKEERLEHVLKIFHDKLKERGKLIVTDFRFSKKKKYFQMILSYLMHKFFKFFASLESQSLKDINAIILKAGFILENKKYFYGDFIFTGLYMKK